MPAKNDRREEPEAMPLLLLGGRRIRRTHADDLKDDFSIPRAIVMDLISVVDHVAAGRNRFHTIGIVFGTGVHPPRARQHRDVTIVRMRMRTAVVMRRPFGENNVKPRFGRVTEQNRLFGPTWTGYPF